eukprot:TRINITY_DN1527_c0_g1_i2.p1 TRINITY_DN1527_c0_g1~~TRINITY_DN1527_c0_g1_i2.p1  ORF type:complete len:191 (-),score=32.99 TRINITY_DN1527_c0_g1_i2:76-648(-)
MYTPKADIWSVGIIAYIMLCGFPPFFSNFENADDANMLTSAPFWFFFNKDTQQLRDQIISGNVKFPSTFWGKISPDAKDFVLSMLQVNPEERSSARELLEHRWLSAPQSRRRRNTLCCSHEGSVQRLSLLSKYNEIASQLSETNEESPMRLNRRASTSKLRRRRSSGLRNIRTLSNIMNSSSELPIPSEI